MELACVTCRETLNVPALVPHSPLIANHGAQSDTPRSAHSAALSHDNGNDQSSSSTTLFGSTDSVDMLTRDVAHSSRAAVLSHVAMARCNACDGLFHIPCLFKLKLRQLQQQQQASAMKLTAAAHATTIIASLFTCMHCSSNSHEDDEDDDDAVAPALLVPVAALPYLDDASAGTTPQQQQQHIDVCTRCRQVAIDASDCVQCSACNDTIVHVRCCVAAGALAVAVTLQQHQVAVAAARKRKRAPPPPLVGPLVRTVCQRCASTATPLHRSSRDVAVGMIATRSVALCVDGPALNGIDANTRRCRHCVRPFCLASFLDADANDAALRACDTSDYYTADWMCVHCTPLPPPSPQPQSSVAVAAAAPPLRRPVASMSTIRPHATQRVVPIAPAERSEFDDLALADEEHDNDNNDNDDDDAVVDASSATPSELVTLLICDGCENEFEMEALDPPLDAIPDGDWFCAACVNVLAPPLAAAAPVGGELLPAAPLTETTETAPETTTTPAAALPIKTVETVAPAETVASDTTMAAAPPESTTIAASETIPAALAVEPLLPLTVDGVLSNDNDNAPLVTVTLLICDGCDGDFEMEAFDPPLVAIPDGDWFCPTCALEQQRRDARNARRRRNAAAKRSLVNAPGSSTSSSALLQVPGVNAIAVAADEELVTHVICDACDGEFDTALLQPPLESIPLGDWFCAACTAQRITAVVDLTALDDVAAAEPDAAAGGAAAAAATTSEHVRNARIRTDASANTSAYSTKKRKRNGLGYQHKRRSKAAKGTHTIDDAASVTAAAALPDVTKEATSAGCDLVLPQPVVRLRRSASVDNNDNEDDDARTANCTSSSTTQATVLLSDDDTSDDDDSADDDAVVIACDLCHAEFATIPQRDIPVVAVDPEVEVVADARVVVVTHKPSPWYCVACIKSLKRSRKKRARFSKLLLLEMQVFGARLRPRGATTYDVAAAAVRGKPPRTHQELATLFALVGKRVGMFLKWDRLWRMGRVLSFDALTFQHVVQFDDGNETTLPLYAFPLVIGTPTMLFVHVPSMTQQTQQSQTQKRWAPAQLLQCNPMAAKLLMQPTTTPGDTNDRSDATAAHFRLVSVFAPRDHAQQTMQNVACWVPKYLCRALTRAAVPSMHSDSMAADADDADVIASIARARRELQVELAVRHTAFQRLVHDVSVDATSSDVVDDVNSTSRVRQLSDALVGLELIDCAAAAYDAVDASHVFIVAAFDRETIELIVKQQTAIEPTDEEVRLELRPLTQRFVVRYDTDFAALAVQFMTHASSIDASDAPAATMSQSPLAHCADADADANVPTCALCLLPGDLATVAVPPPAAALIDNKSRSSSLDALIACTKCELRFHRACCDPPFDAIPLLHDAVGDSDGIDDHAVLLDAIDAPFVCSNCVTCAGCLKHIDMTATNWSQWRLPLQIVTLCGDCVVSYNAKQFCAVCLRVLDADALATCVALHACSTCTRWVHAACEPDRQHHPAAFSATTTAEAFELDVLLELPPLPVALATTTTDSLSSTANDDSATDAARLESSNESVAAKASTGHAPSNAARLADDAHALNLRFSDAYDPHVLHAYECIACRTLRILRVLYKLRLEDKLELFHEPVTRAIAPTYFDVIKQPMDLTTMQRKALALAYTRIDLRDVRDDFELLCLNAVTFNSRERDFLIWREAWRFYTHGQRILRQLAPKSRMEQRGGKYYDALVLAAKRQLPTNSKTLQLHDLHSLTTTSYDDDLVVGSTTRMDDGDDNVDMDDSGSGGGLIDEKTNDSALEAVVGDRTDAADRATGDSNAANNTEAATSSSNNTTSALPGDAVTPLMRSSAFRASARKPLPTAVEPPSTAIVLQTELGVSRLPQSAIPVFSMLQTRAAAHTYAWMDLCLACGSAGLRDEMIFCVDCGECFHTFCAPRDVGSGAAGTAVVDVDAVWRCINCQMCELCGRPGTCATASTSTTNDDAPTAAAALHFCASCHCGFHGACVVPAIKSRRRTGAASSSSQPIYCAKCVACQQCNKQQPETSYSYDCTMCWSCRQTQQFEATLKVEKAKPLVQLWATDARRIKKDAEKCPLCKLRWDADDEDLIQCDACELWAHPLCDALLRDDPERYRRLVEDPSAQYICACCRPLERAHLTNVPGSWKVHVLLQEIQAKRMALHATWSEARDQLERAQQWKHWRDHTPVYLYLLRLGEECLKSLACRSVNFRNDWSRCPKAHELALRNVVVPAWLVHKASRYMRFKRYARGPRAAQRRLERKTNSFYSRQGVETHSDASAIATIVSEASSAVAFLACVQLLYGWRPLPRVALHLLSHDAARAQQHAPLSDALLQMLVGETSHGNPMSLDDEIAMIQTQYERRVGKKPVAVIVVSDGDSNDAANRPAGATAKDDATDEHTQPLSLTTATAIDAAMQQTQDAVLTTTNDATISGAPLEQASLPPRAAIRPHTLPNLSRAPALCGWPSPASPSSTTASVAAAAAIAITPLGDAPSEQLAVATMPPAPTAPLDVYSARGAFSDNRFCAFCFMMGDDAICGRLLSTDKDQWVHVNCALWSVEVFETADGVLQKCQKAKTRSRLLRCDACGVLGASVGCAVSRCQRHFHFPCAYDHGVVFLPTGETCCPKPEHIALIARKHAALEVVAVPLDELTAVDESVAEPAPVDELTTAEAEAEAEAENESGVSPDGTALTAEGGNAATPDEPMEVDESVETDKPMETAADAMDEQPNCETEPLGDDDDDDDEKERVDKDVAAGDAVVGAMGDDDAVSVDPAAPMSTNDTITQIADPTGDADDVDMEDATGTDNAAAVALPPAAVLPVVDPSREPRRHLRSDVLVPLADLKKQGVRGHKRTRVPQALRVGALTIQSFGAIVVGNASFHCRDAIYPLGFRSTRIFWSCRTRATRCLYECVITSSLAVDADASVSTKRKRSLSADAIDATPSRTRSCMRAVFQIVASDDRAHPIVAFSPDAAVTALRVRLAALYDDDDNDSTGNETRSPASNVFTQRTSWGSYGLTGSHFFGCSVPRVAAELEQLRDAATTSIRRCAVAQRRLLRGNTGDAALDANNDDEPYVFTHSMPSLHEMADAVQRIEQLVAVEERAQRSTGSMRTDGVYALDRNEQAAAAPQSTAVRRRLQKHVRREQSDVAGKNSTNHHHHALTVGGTATTAPVASVGSNHPPTTTKSSSSSSGGVAMDLEHLPIAMQYRELRRRPFSDRLEVRKSTIHGYGLFTKEPMAEGQMIVEYQGQRIDQQIADVREQQYEEQGIGSCYMFRLDDHTIIDATRVGNLARFINHSCDPKAFARVVTVDESSASSSGGHSGTSNLLPTTSSSSTQEKKIVIFAKRAIDAGDEVTYDYKFPIEDDAIRCDCSAPNCIGRMN